MADWNARYTSDDYLFGTEPAVFVRRHGDCVEPGDKVLCVADGEGRNAVWLAERGARVTAWDASTVAVEKAQRLARDRGVDCEFSVVHAEDYGWPDGTFDVVVAIFVQFAGSDLRARMFQGMKRATRPGGLVLLHGYTPKQFEYGTGGPSHVENFYTEAILRETFGGWDILALESYEADLAEGTAHAGRSALIDLVARRPG